MTILAVIFMGILTVLVCASEGDYGPAKKMGEILLYVILFVVYLAFLAVTGVAGLFLTIIVAVLVAIGSSNQS